MPVLYVLYTIQFWIDELVWRTVSTIPFWFFGALTWTSLIYIHFFFTVIFIILVKRVYLRYTTLPFLIFKISSILFTPDYLVSWSSHVITNPLLAKIFNYYHPPLFYILGSFLLTKALSQLFMRNKLIFYYYTYIITTLTFIILGMEWAFFEETWGGWWNWDSSELLSLFYLYMLMYFYHFNAVYTINQIFFEKYMRYWFWFQLYFVILQKTFKLTTHNFNVVFETLTFYDLMFWNIPTIVITYFYYHYSTKPQPCLAPWMLVKIPTLEGLYFLLFFFLNILIIEFFFLINCFLAYTYLIQKLALIATFLIVGFLFSKLSLSSLNVVPVTSFMLTFKTTLFSFFISQILNFSRNQVLIVHVLILALTYLLAYESSYFYFFNLSHVYFYKYNLSFLEACAKNWISSSYSSALLLQNNFFVCDIFQTETWQSLILHTIYIILYFIISILSWYM